MGSDGFGFSSLADHEQLGQDGHRLQVDGECPQDLKWREIMVDKEGQTSHGHYQEFNAECVVVAVVGCLEFHEHQVDGGIGRANEDALHGGVVEGDEVGEDIKISASEDQGKHDLGLARDTCTRPGLPYLQHQQDNSQKMG